MYSAKMDKNIQQFNNYANIKDQGNNDNVCCLSNDNIMENQLIKIINLWLAAPKGAKLTNQTSANDWQMTV